MLDQGKRLGTSFYKFQRKYYESDFMGYNWELRPGSRKDIENKVKDICIVLKAKDYLKLPDCIQNTIMADLPLKVRSVYKELEKNLSSRYKMM